MIDVKTLTDDELDALAAKIAAEQQRRRLARRDQAPWVYEPGGDLPEGPVRPVFGARG